eukprot:TRINITY_DN42341_c0_g1_i1.p1 TRINITY_DN42341_c0_g1~~TRINITY_DN42341_c0_g1_i1.p1  ORF type:complete len:100 (-),score=3.49 TRINITY_DN42341_c0_g1_i1:195-494(-)
MARHHHMSTDFLKEDIRERTEFGTKDRTGTGFGTEYYFLPGSRTGNSSFFVTPQIRIWIHDLSPKNCTRFKCNMVPPCTLHIFNQLTQCPSMATSLSFF